MPEISDNPQWPLAVDVAAQSEYARLAGMSEAALTATIEPWLPIVLVRLFVLLRRPSSALQRVEAALRAEE